MKYMLLIYSDENAWTEGEREQCFAESTALTHELHKEGKFLGASPLHPVSTATSVRVRQGVRQVTRRPFHRNAREQLWRLLPGARRSKPRRRDRYRGARTRWQKGNCGSSTRS